MLVLFITSISKNVKVAPAQDISKGCTVQRKRGLFESRRELQILSRVMSVTNICDVSHKSVRLVTNMCDVSHKGGLCESQRRVM